MYFLTSLFLTVASGALWFAFRDRKALHLDILTIIYGSASLMWFVDCIFSAASGEGFLSFEQIDGWIALATSIGGLFLWLVVAFVINNGKKTQA